MTEPHDPLDELASAHLDGETTDAEAARIAADPDLLARVERLAAAREALRSSVAPVDEARRDDAIAAALSAFDEGATGVVVPLTAARRASPPRRALQLVGIAAAVILLALTVPLIGHLRSGSNDDTASDVQATGEALDQGAADSAAGSKAVTTTAGADAARPDLGSFAQLPDLAEVVRSRLGSTSSDATLSSPMAAAAGPDAATCPTARQLSGAPAIYVAVAELAGRAVVVVVREAPDGAHTITVLDRQDCTTVTAGRL